jgi:cardiolipin synthase
MQESPRWLVALVVARDAVIALGVLAWHRILHTFEARPSWLSKATTAAQIGYVLLVLADRAFAWQVPMAIPVWTVAVLTAASGLDYVVRWGLLARRELDAGKRST